MFISFCEFLNRVPYIIFPVKGCSCAMRRGFRETFCTLKNKHFPYWRNYTTQIILVIDHFHFFNSVIYPSSSNKIVLIIVSSLCRWYVILVTYSLVSPPSARCLNLQLLVTSFVTAVTLATFVVFPS